jgi:segregation and condensation protein A
LYKIKLDQFEGPLDLLLFFIKRDELNIYDIPISRITKEFLEYVNLIKMLDLEAAGDFILMASTLMPIKVRSACRTC